LNFLDRFLKKYRNIKFHENEPSVSRTVPCGLTETQTDGQTNMTKLIVVFRMPAN